MKKGTIDFLLHLLSFSILIASVVLVLFFKYSAAVFILAFALSWVLIYVILPVLKKRWPR